MNRKSSKQKTRKSVAIVGEGISEREYFIGFKRIERLPLKINQNSQKIQVILEFSTKQSN